MCGRITLMTYEEIGEVLKAIGHGERMHLDHSDNPGNRAQARPGSSVHAIISSIGDSGDNFSVESFTWGFEAPWNKRLIFNTRIEQALSGTRMWAHAINDGRCILPAATFFEPHQSETARSPRTGRQMKRQYEFSSPSGEPLLLASIQQGGHLSVVTTEPNAAVSPIHARMPLVLRFDEIVQGLACGRFQF